MLRRYLRDLLDRYSEIFCGDVQVLGKVKAALSQMDDPDLAREVKGLKKTTKLGAFSALVDGIA
jgi:tRNA-dihydrouridine synthase B